VGCIHARRGSLGSNVLLKVSPEIPHLAMEYRTNGAPLKPAMK
jgi:hypothetical protein